MTPRPTMAKLVEDYLDFRRRHGYLMRGIDHQLRHFARYADRNGHRGPITIVLALRWARLPTRANPSWWARRLSFVRGLARHRHLFDPRTEIPAPRLLQTHRSRPAPHIYSAAEVAALLRAAAAIPSTVGLRPWTYVTLFGLLAATGLRISEALRLTRAAVDLVAGVLTVTETKFRKSRLVPLHSSTITALRRYSRLRDRHHPRPSSLTFLLDDDGDLSSSRVSRTFCRLRQELGWTNGQRPRIHDLRHTMAARRLLRWYEAGVDVHGKIAALSTYLGHAEVTDTYWYLSAVPALLALVSSRFERFAAQRRK
jgi:integrase